MDLIERLEAARAAAEETDEAERDHNDPTARCVFVDMRPEDFDALLREAAAALRAVREAPVIDDVMVERARHGYNGCAGPHSWKLREALRFALHPETIIPVPHDSEVV